MRSLDLASGRSVERLYYDDIRLSIKNGDVLMYRGRTLPSRIIRWVTGSRYSHAGLAAWWNSRLMVMEAVGKGVVVTPLSTNVRRYHGGVEWFTCLEEIAGPDRLRMIEFAQQELGKEYGRWKAIRLGLRILLQKDRKQRDTLRRERQLFCSHYVAQAYNAAGKDLKVGTSDRFMSPADVAGSALLRRAGVLLKSPAKAPGRRREEGEQPRTSSTIPAS